MYSNMVWRSARIGVSCFFSCLPSCLSRSLLLRCLFLALTGGCFLEPARVNVAPTISPGQPVPPGPHGLAWTDELAVMRGICFESAADAAGRVFVLRSADELSHFFDLADNSRLCRRLVQRGAFDFSTGRILAGTWSYGTGCTARHIVHGVTRDDDARSLTIALTFVTEGECPYELVRPFWIGLDGVSDYAVDIVVQPEPGF